eukprot:1158156-Pelagomonas_calceolata.AAC.5
MGMNAGLSYDASHARQQSKATGVNLARVYCTSQKRSAFPVGLQARAGVGAHPQQWDDEFASQLAQGLNLGTDDELEQAWRAQLGVGMGLWMFIGGWLGGEEQEEKAPKLVFPPCTAPHKAVRTTWHHMPAHAH